MTGNGETTASAMEFGNSHQDLVSRKNGNFGKIAITVVIILLLAVAGGLFILLYRQMTPPVYSEAQKLIPITLDKIINGAFEPKRFNGTWISDDEILMKNSEGHIVIVNVRTKINKTVLPDAKLTSLANDIYLSADQKYLLIGYLVQRLYRYSTFSQYAVYNIEKQDKNMITDKEGKPLVLQLVKWTPTGNGFVYVFKNDIYYRPSADSNNEYMITNSSNLLIYNGICDWVYEEEVLSDTSAMWFSPSGKHLAFIKFDDQKTDVMSIPLYGEPGDMFSQYPRTINVRYPKPGRTNPSVNVYVANLEDLQNEPIKTVVKKKEYSFTTYTEPILSAVTWISDDKLSLMWMNRIQNKSIILICDTKTEECKEAYRLESANGWVDISEAPKFSTDGKLALSIAPDDRDADHYRHLLVRSLETGDTTFITSGRYTVIAILHWDQEKHVVYFSATEEDQPSNQQVYKIHDETRNEAPQCLSCENTENTCKFSNAEFSKNGSFFVQTCAGPDIPYVHIFDVNNTKVLTWEENENLRNSLKDVSLPEKKFMKVRINDGMEAQVKLLLPPNIQKSGDKKYPLLVNVYGGPNSNQVFNRFKIAWETYLCVNHDVVIAYIDGRGSGLKGDRMMFSNYRSLGSSEIDDQLNVTRFIQKSLPYIDTKKTSVWGWSYGGYATGMILTKDTQKVFKCGASVAPVTDWIYYDSIYTERYMGLPIDDNGQGYRESSLVLRSPKLANKKYLLIHGTMDDNVHYQQSMMLSRALEHNDILFRQQTYPDEAHSLGGVRYHFYHTLEEFLVECWS